MNSSTQLAKHFREVFFGGNWTCSNLKDNLADVTYQQATTQVHGINTIATLVYHMSYYVSAVLAVLQGAPLSAKDAESFSHPAINNQTDWDNMLAKVWADADAFATLIAQLPEHKLWENFTDEKYGSYFRNLNGIIEHTHYHLGQIALVKKIIQQTT
jgi:uncharacterized damage-inducible protein DinB